MQLRAIARKEPRVNKPGERQWTRKYKKGKKGSRCGPLAGNSRGGGAEKKGESQGRRSIYREYTNARARGTLLLCHLHFLFLRARSFFGGSMPRRDEDERLLFFFSRESRQYWYRNSAPAR